MRMIVRRWERMRPTRQALLAYAVSLLLLLVIHLSFFPRISTARAVGYAVFEALVVAGLLVLATQAELARRRQEPRD